MPIALTCTYVHLILLFRVGEETHVLNSFLCGLTICCFGGDNKGHRSCFATVVAVKATSWQLLVLSKRIVPKENVHENKWLHVLWISVSSFLYFARTVAKFWLAPDITAIVHALKLLHTRNAWLNAVFEHLVTKIFFS